MRKLCRWLFFILISPCGIAQSITAFTDYRAEASCITHWGNQCEVVVIDIEMPTKMQNGDVLETIQKQLIRDIFSYSDTMADIEYAIAEHTNSAPIKYQGKYQKTFERYFFEHNYYNADVNDGYDFYWGRTVYNKNGLYTMYAHHSGFHPNYFFPVERPRDKYLTFNLKTGESMRWIDLFRTDCKSKVEGVVVAEIVKGKYEGLIFSEEDLNQLRIRDYGTFRISDEGLVLLFQNELTCGLCNPIEVIIPVHEIKRYLKQDYQSLF